MLNVALEMPCRPRSQPGDVGPTSLEGVMNRVYYNLGNRFFDQSEYERAIRAYRLAIDCDPGDVAAWYNLGLCYALVGRQDAMDWAFRQVKRLRGPVGDPGAAA